nr:MAG TPA: hypothetical protein [Caudoviricetes sp.]
MVTTRAFALRDAGGWYACQMPIDGERFRCRSPFLFHNLVINSLSTMQTAPWFFSCLYRLHEGGAGNFYTKNQERRP